MDCLLPCGARLGVEPQFQRSPCSTSTKVSAFERTSCNYGSPAGQVKDRAPRIAVCSLALAGGLHVVLPRSSHASPSD